MKNPKHEAMRWLRQAENDLEFARTGLVHKFYAQTCFLCQQAGEKAVKAVHYGQGERFVLGHSIHGLLKKMDDPKAKLLLDQAGILDQYYIPARYPNGLPEGAPFEVYARKQAEEALSYAEALIRFARKYLNMKDEGKRKKDGG